MVNEKSAREQARDISDGKTNPHFIGDHSLESASQKIESYKQSFDSDSVKSLYGKEVTAYIQELHLVNELATKFKLPQVENLATPRQIKKWGKI